MITSLQLTNMRCFKSFLVENLGQLTLISGENNVGKSTLLEGIFLLFAYNAPDLFMRVNAIRGIPVLSFAPEVLWEPLFYGLNASEELKIICHDEGGASQSVSLQKAEQVSLAHIPQISAQPDMRPLPGGYPLKITYQNKKKKTVGHFLPQANGMSAHWDSPPPQIQSLIHYMGPRSTDHINGIAQVFGKAELAGNKPLLIETIQLLDESIIDISTIVFNNSAYLYARKSNGALLPLSAMGDGINKLLMILCVMLASPGCIMLIDEIENGFHYSFYQKLWQTINAVSRKTNCQIFATTHSYECIQGAATILEADNASDSSFRYIRLGKKDGAIHPYVFSSESLDLAIKSEMEIR